MWSFLNFRRLILLPILLFISITVFSNTVLANTNDNEVFKVDVISVDDVQHTFTLKIENLTDKAATDIHITTTVPKSLIGNDQKIEWKLDKLKSKQSREFTFKLNEKTSIYEPTSFDDSMISTKNKGSYKSKLPSTGEIKSNPLMLSLIGIILIGLGYLFRIKISRKNKFLNLLGVFLILLLSFSEAISVSALTEKFEYTNKVVVNGRSHMFLTEIKANFSSELTSEGNSQVSSTTSISKDGNSTTEHSSGVTSTDHTSISTSENGNKTSESSSFDMTSSATSISKDENSTTEHSSGITSTDHSSMGMSESENKTSESSGSNSSSSTTQSSENDDSGTSEDNPKKLYTITGFAYDSSDNPLSDIEVTIKNGNQVVEKLTTDNEGYFFTHLIHGQTYTLNSEKLDVTITPKSSDDIEVVNNVGKISLGRILKSENGSMKLKESTIYLDSNEMEYELSDDYNQLTIKDDADIKVGDIMVLPPSDSYIGGLAIEVLEVEKGRQHTVLKVKNAELEKALISIEGTATDIDISKGVFIPVEGIVENEIAPASIGGEASSEIVKEIKFESGALKFKGNIGIKGTVSADVGINWLSIDKSEINISPNLSFSVDSETTLSGKINKVQNIGTIVITIPPLPFITINIPIDLVFSADGKIKVEAGMINTVSTKVGCKDGKAYADNPIFKTKVNTKISGKITSKTGIQGSVAIALLTVNEAAKLGIGAGINMNADATLIPEKNILEVKGKIDGYGNAKYSFPILKNINKDWGSDKTIVEKTWKIQEINEKISSGNDNGNNDGKDDGESGEKPGDSSGNQGGTSEEKPSDDSKNWVNVNVSNFPDKYLREDLLNYNNYNDRWPEAREDVYDKDKNYLYTKIDVNALKTLHITDSLVSDLTGIKLFKNLEALDISNAMNLKKIDLSDMDLKDVSISNTDLQDTNFKNMPYLKSLWFEKSNLTNLDASSLPSLEYLGCVNGILETINTSGSKNIISLDIRNNNISNLDLSRLINLRSIFADNNNLTSLDITGLKALAIYYKKSSFTMNQITDVYMNDSEYGLTDVEISLAFSENASKINVHSKNKTDVWIFDGNQYNLESEVN